MELTKHIGRDYVCHQMFSSRALISPHSRHCSCQVVATSSQHSVANMTIPVAEMRPLQEGFDSELVDVTNTTGYNGTFIWKIPEVRKRRGEARSGRTISLYSAPFYTSRHGYKMCLRLYLNGDGNGTGSHLSFFFLLMKGEYDALLLWPFKQLVTMMLVDQRQPGNKNDISHSFKPDFVSPSFQQPSHDMNVASGCPKFAPLSILDDSSYIKDDTMFLKCIVDTTGMND